MIGHVIALMSGENSVKSLIITKNVKAIKFEGFWGDIKSKKQFDTNSGFRVKKGTTEKG